MDHRESSHEEPEDETPAPLLPMSDVRVTNLLNLVRYE